MSLTRYASSNTMPIRETTSEVIEMGLTAVDVTTPAFRNATLKAVIDSLEHRVSRKFRRHLGQSSLVHPLVVIEYPEPKVTMLNKEKPSDR